MTRHTALSPHEPLGMPSREMAISVALEMIGRGDRPTYRIKKRSAGTAEVVEVEQMPWLLPIVGHGDTLGAARAMIAQELGADPTTFDVEID
jgi:hypothetical protein